MQNFKEYMTKVIKDQSSKIQVRLKKIQLNAQMLLRKIRDMNQNPKNGNEVSDKLKREFVNEYQIESPISENIENNIKRKARSGKSFGNHYTSTGFGVSATANYVPTYHHHSIGFDPINIVVSMSLLSFLLQALQGFLTRTRLPTPVVEARSVTNENWVKNLDKNNPYKNVNDEFLKRKLRKKYY
ncbi:unnamed protein product, partial [Brenthis ino]